MPPIAGVEFLSVKEQRSRRRCRIGASSEVGNVWNPLLLVDDQVLDNREVFRFRLLNHVRRSVAVGASIVHVDVNVSTHPAEAGVAWNIERPQMQDKLYFLARL